MKDELKFQKDNIKTAILIDGGFYRKRAKSLFGNKTPKERAEEIQLYCNKLLRSKFENRNLYRIFYYDCPPTNKVVYHPLTNKSVNLKKSDDYMWMTDFITELTKMRKVALRMGRLSDEAPQYQLKYDTLKKLFRNEITLDNITENDFQLSIKQKGVDMRIGVDISSLAYKKQVQQIILIAGDSDFVPAAKQARREGIDFILDPMKSHINEDLFEHIDGIQSSVSKFLNPKNSNDKDLITPFIEGLK
ncbi:MAG: NYN domain-containing protein [Clostridia bacterium]|nr:NYN domain-containing protein [Clostridia bacterium]